MLSRLDNLSIIAILEKRLRPFLMFFSNVRCLRDVKTHTFRYCVSFRSQWIALFCSCIALFAIFIHFLLVIKRHSYLHSFGLFIHQKSRKFVEKMETWRRCSKMNVTEGIICCAFLMLYFDVYTKSLSCVCIDFTFLCYVYVVCVKVFAFLNSCKSLTSKHWALSDWTQSPSLATYSSFIYRFVSVDPPPLFINVWDLQSLSTTGGNMIQCLSSSNGTAKKGIRRNYDWLRREVSSSSLKWV